MSYIIILLFIIIAIIEWGLQDPRSLNPYSESALTPESWNRLNEHNVISTPSHVIFILIWHILPLLLLRRFLNTTLYTPLCSHLECEQTCMNKRMFSFLLRTHFVAWNGCYESKYLRMFANEFNILHTCGSWTSFLLKRFLLHNSKYTSLVLQDPKDHHWCEQIWIWMRYILCIIAHKFTMNNDSTEGIAIPYKWYF